MNGMKMGWIGVAMRGLRDMVADVVVWFVDCVEQCARDVKLVWSAICDGQQLLCKSLICKTHALSSRCHTVFIKLLKFLQMRCHTHCVLYINAVRRLKRRALSLKKLLKRNGFRPDKW